uniref:Uncharacterized protein n=1 Tax=Anopheles culicifacies TaxID=139723 RepID=A0A182M8F3_9DIPT
MPKGWMDEWMVRLELAPHTGRDPPSATFLIATYLSILLVPVVVPCHRQGSALWDPATTGSDDGGDESCCEYAGCLLLLTVNFFISTALLEVEEPSLCELLECLEDASRPPSLERWRK